MARNAQAQYSLPRGKNHPELKGLLVFPVCEPERVFRSVRFLSRKKRAVCCGFSMPKGSSPKRGGSIALLRGLTLTLALALTASKTSTKSGAAPAFTSELPHALPGRRSCSGR